MKKMTSETQKPKDNQNKMKPRGRKRKLAASAMLSLRLLFGGPQLASSNSNTFQSGGNSETEISRVSEQNSPSMSDLNQAQPEQVRKGTQIALKIPSGGDSSRPSKFGPGSKAKGAAKRDFARRQRRQTSNKPTSSKSSGSIFAEAFTVEPKFPARPGRNGDGLFGRFTPQLTPDPHNPGCAGGPRSITVLSGQRNSDSSTNLTAHDGFEAKLTDKSENHLTSKHGHKFGVDNPLPRNPNQKPTKFEQTRTRLNNENKAKVREEIKSILSNTKSDVYTDVSIRGIQGRVYHCKDTNRVVGIHTEGKFAGQIMKAQPISERQLEFLRELNILD
jgi:hypothetical protein